MALPRKHFPLFITRSTSYYTSCLIPALCVKAVLDSEEGVCCDESCDRWFHRECLKMPKAKYQRISSDRGIKWRCARTDCKSTDDPINGKLDAILNMLSSLATKTELANRLESIKNKLDKVTTKLEDI